MRTTTLYKGSINPYGNYYNLLRMSKGISGITLTKLLQQDVRTWDQGKKEKLLGRVKEGQLSAAIAMDQQLPLITVQLGKKQYHQGTVRWWIGGKYHV